MTRQQFRTMDLRPLPINSMDVVEHGIKIAHRKKYCKRCKGIFQSRTFEIDYPSNKMENIGTFKQERDVCSSDCKRTQNP